MSNQNPIQGNISNIPIHPNHMNQMNPLNPLNQMTFLMNNNFPGNLLQNNIQINQKFFFEGMNMAIERCDLDNFSKLLQEYAMYLNIPQKNFLLNKLMLLYLNTFSKGNFNNFSQGNLEKLVYIYKQMINWLLKYRANPNLKLRYPNIINTPLQNIAINNNNSDNYCLFSLVEKNDIELVKMFLENGANVDIMDSMGRNSLFYLMLEPYNANNLIDRSPLCTLLLSKNIKINYLDKNGISPIMESVKKGYGKLLSLLIKYNGDVDMVNFNDGNTAVHYAVKNRDIGALYTLLSKGSAKLEIQNKEGKFPIDLVDPNNVSDKDIYNLLMKKIKSNYDQDKENKEEESVGGESINSENKGSKETGTSNNNNKRNNNNGNSSSIIDSSNTDNDKMFEFPRDDITSRVEIPFVFQNNPSFFNGGANNIDNDNDFPFNPGNMNNNRNSEIPRQFSSYIKIQNTPTLFLDISDEVKQEKLIFDCLKSEKDELGNTLLSKEKTLNAFKMEGENLSKQKESLNNELIQKQNEIGSLTELINQETLNHREQNQKNLEQMEQIDKAIQELLMKFKNLENTIKKEEIENHKEEYLAGGGLEDTEDIVGNNKNFEEENMKYLEKKFSEKYSETHAINLLTADLYDLYHYSKIIHERRIQEINKIINILKDNIDISVEIKLFGSYATFTSLVWSEVDLLIIPNTDLSRLNEYSTGNETLNFINNLYQKLVSYFKKAILTLAETQLMAPIIRLETIDNNNSKLVYNIYTLNNKNFEEGKNLDDNSLLNNIKMTNEINNKYKGKFIPILLGLKDLFYNAKLLYNCYNFSTCGGNGRISSYALNIMLMSFLTQYQCDISDISIGQLFVNFLKIHGTDNINPNIIYLEYNNNGQNDKNEEIKNLKETEISYIKDGKIDVNDLLVIIDPFNVANSFLTREYRIIKSVLMFFYLVLKDSCECSCHYNSSVDYEGKTHSILSSIFKSLKKGLQIKISNSRQNK